MWKKYEIKNSSYNCGVAGYQGYACAAMLNLCHCFPGWSRKSPESSAPDWLERADRPGTKWLTKLLATLMARYLTDWNRRSPSVNLGLLWRLLQGSSCCDWPQGLFQIAEEQPGWEICSLQTPPQSASAAELTEFGIERMLTVSRNYSCRWRNGQARQSSVHR